MVSHQRIKEKIRRKTSSLPLNVNKIGKVYSQQSKNEKKAHSHASQTNHGRPSNSRKRWVQLQQRLVLKIPRKAQQKESDKRCQIVRHSETLS